MNGHVSVVCSCLWPSLFIFCDLSFLMLNAYITRIHVPRHITFACSTIPRSTPPPNNSKSKTQPRDRLEQRLASRSGPASQHVGLYALQLHNLWRCSDQHKLGTQRDMTSRARFGDTSRQDVMGLRVVTSFQNLRQPMGLYLPAMQCVFGSRHL